MVVDDRRDRLVLPPGAGLRAWWVRLVEVLRGTWRVLVPVLLVACAAPAAAAELVVRLGGTPWLPLALPVLAGGVAFGWSAAAFAMTRWAAALPHRPGAALRYAAWRFPRVWPWTLLVLGAVGAGLALLVAPGLALAVALSVALPVASFERANPVRRSWRLVRPWARPVAARTAILAGAALIWAGLARLLADAVVADGGWPLVAATAVLAAGLSLPAPAVAFAGTLVTFAELRGGELPLRAVTLAGELESPRLIVAAPSVPPSSDPSWPPSSGS